MALYEKDLVAVDHLEKVDTTVSVSSDLVNDARIERFTPEEQKKIIRRIDRRLVLTLGFLYCVSLMDRTNTGIAVIAGMGVDLKLIGNRYSIIVLVFFITYVLLQPPATVILRKVGPRIFLPSITLLWGMTMICSKLRHLIGTYWSILNNESQWALSRHGLKSSLFASFLVSSKQVSSLAVHTCSGMLKLLSDKNHCL